MNKKVLSSELDMSLLKKLNETIASLLLKDKEIISRNQVVNEHNVYQLARKDNRPAIFNLLTECLKEGSTIQGIENWDTFYNNYKNGQSSLIFAEHKSNLDVIIFDYLMAKQGQKYEEAFNEIVFIAGRRLNEDSLTVKLFAEMYTRLIVAAKTETQHANQEEMEQIYKINYASQMYLKNHIKDHIYFIYPTGTRARVWDHSTYKVLTESVNYLRKFDQVIFLSVDGNCMFPLPNIGMDSEPVVKDKIILQFSKAFHVKELIQKAQEEFEQKKENEQENFKTFLASKIEDYIYGQKRTLPWKEDWVAVYEHYINKFEKS